MESKHTPTPWKVVSEKNEGTADPLDRTICILDKGGALIATMNENELDASGIDNAAFIVSAVNAHEELLAALKLFDMGSAPEGDKFQWTFPREKYLQIKQAIAKAEGK